MLSIEALIWKCDIGTTTTFLVRVPSEEDSVTSPDSGSNQVPLLVNCVNTLPVTHALARDKTTGSFTSVMLKVNVSSKDNSFWSVVVSCGAVLDLGICCYAGKGQGELRLLRRMWDLCVLGDVLLTDRLMCSWTEMVIRGRHRSNVHSDTHAGLGDRGHRWATGDTGHFCDRVVCIAS